MSSTPWAMNAIRKIAADVNRSADTHLIPIQFPAYPNIHIYLKDESSHPTGSLKHRLARSLFLYGLCNGWIAQQTTIVEASSGSTAVSEAYFARLLGLDFIAVMPKSTSTDKIAAIEFYGGRCHLVDDARTIYQESASIAEQCGGHYMDQFTYAERATDWRANNNIAESIFEQMRDESYPIPAWLVAGAGTGGTTATLGRYRRYRQHPSKILCVDPENSLFFDHFRRFHQQSSSPLPVLKRSSRIEGIGRGRVEPSFLPSVIDAMLKVADTLSLGAMYYLSAYLGRRVGASTGTNFVGVLYVAQQMHAMGQPGSIVSILCDSGERYAHSYYNDDWLAQQGLDISAAQTLVHAAVSGEALPEMPWCTQQGI